jgi:hypothetical protein
MKMRKKKHTGWIIIGVVLLALVPLVAWASAPAAMIPRS